MMTAPSMAVSERKPKTPAEGKKTSKTARPKPSANSSTAQTHGSIIFLLCAEGGRMSMGGHSAYAEAAIIPSVTVAANSPANV